MISSGTVSEDWSAQFVQSGRTLTRIDVIYSFRGCLCIAGGSYIVSRRQVLPLPLITLGDRQGYASLYLRSRSHTNIISQSDRLANAEFAIYQIILVSALCGRYQLLTPQVLK